MGNKPNDWDQLHGGPGSKLSVVQDPEDGNKYLVQSVRCCNFSSIQIGFNTQCVDPSSASNNNGKYRLRLRYRSHTRLGGTSENGLPGLQLRPGGNIGNFPVAID